MELKNPVLVVSDMDVSLAFYQKILQQKIIHDFGANKVLSSGLALQSLSSYQKMTGIKNILFGGRSFELYFEDENLDLLMQRLKKEKAAFVHLPIEHSWGQKAVRFFDPDGHIIEVGEPMKQVCLRFLNQGLSLEQTARLMDVSLDYIQECLKS